MSSYGFPPEQDEYTSIRPFGWEWNLRSQRMLICQALTITIMQICVYYTWAVIRGHWE